MSRMNSSKMNYKFIAILFMRSSIRCSMSFKQRTTNGNIWPGEFRYSSSSFHSIFYSTINVLSLIDSRKNLGIRWGWNERVKVAAEGVGDKKNKKIKKKWKTRRMNDMRCHCCTRKRARKSFMGENRKLRGWSDDSISYTTYINTRNVGGWCELKLARETKKTYLKKNFIRKWY